MTNESHQPPPTSSQSEHRADSDSHRAAFPLRRSVGRLAPRFGMLTLMLVAGLVCVWSAYINFRSSNSQLEREIKAIEQLSTELLVDDLTRMAIVRRRPSWYDESIWDVHLPQGFEFRLALSTQNIVLTHTHPAPPRPEPAAETVLGPGRYSIEYRKEETDKGWKLLVLVDNKILIEHLEAKDWYGRHGSSGGAHFTHSQQPTDMSAPVVLFSRRFMKPSGAKNSYKAPDGPTEGVELRIEAIPLGAESKSTASGENETSK